MEHWVWLMDSGAMVRLALNWTTVPEQIICMDGKEQSWNFSNPLGFDLWTREPDIFFKVWWQNATLFIYFDFITYIHSFNHNTFIRRHSLKHLSRYLTYCTAEEGVRHSEICGAADEAVVNKVHKQSRPNCNWKLSLNTLTSTIFGCIDFSIALHCRKKNVWFLQYMMLKRSW